MFHVMFCVCMIILYICIPCSQDYVAHFTAWQVIAIISGIQELRYAMVSSLELENHVYPKWKCVESWWMFSFSNFLWSGDRPPLIVMPKKGPAQQVFFFFSLQTVISLFTVPDVFLPTIRLFIHEKFCFTFLHISGNIILIN